MIEWLKMNSLNIVLFELIFLLCLHRWFIPIVNFICSLSLYVAITTVSIKWLFFCGSKSYTIYYSKTSDEKEIQYTIEFPAVWM